MTAILIKGWEVAALTLGRTWRPLYFSILGMQTAVVSQTAFHIPPPATWPAPAPVPLSVSPPLHSLSPSLSFWVYCRPGVRDIGTASIRLLVVVLCGQQMPNKLPSMHTHASTQTSNTCKCPIEHQMSGKGWFIKGNVHPKSIFCHHLLTLRLLKKQKQKKTWQTFLCRTQKKGLKHLRNNTKQNKTNKYLN